MLSSLAFAELVSVPGSSPAPGLLKVGVLGFFGCFGFFFSSFKSRIVGLSLITMDTRQIESRICARDLVFKCLRKSGRISCCESGESCATAWVFVGKKIVGIGCAVCLSLEIWLLASIHFHHGSVFIFCFIRIFVWTIKGKFGLLSPRNAFPACSTCGFYS